MTEFENDTIATCTHCDTTLQVATVTGRWERERYAQCGHTLPSYKVDGQAVVEDDLRFVPEKWLKKEVRTLTENVVS